MRALRRHHRERRIAAVSKQARLLGDIDSDHERRFVRIWARTRTTCSCYACKSNRRERASKREQRLAADLRERCATALDGFGEGLDHWDDWWLDERAEQYATDCVRRYTGDSDERWMAELDTMLDEYERLRTQDIERLSMAGRMTLAEATNVFRNMAACAALGITSPFGESGYDDGYGVSLR